MVKYENRCCDCATPGYPCVGPMCELRHVPVYICDKCGREVDTLYDYDEGEWCDECILGNYPVIE